MKELIRPPRTKDDVEKWQWEVCRLLNIGRLSGPTADRPAGARVGQPYFDEDLGQPIWFKGPGWVDGMGGAV